MGVIVRIEHARRLGLCARGVREFCEREGIDYTDLVINGIDSDVLLSVSASHAFVIGAIAEAEKEQVNG